MIDQLKLQKDFDDTFTQLEQVISKFDNENFNLVPFEGSWTAGMDVQHVILASKGTAHEIAAEGITAERNPEQFVERFREIFLDMDKKMKSPAFIDPENKNYEKKELLTNIAKIHSEVIGQITKVDLSEICTSFEMPGFGHLSRFELVSFVIFHTKRHTMQLENILAKL